MESTLPPTISIMVALFLLLVITKVTGTFYISDCIHIERNGNAMICKLPGDMSSSLIVVLSCHP